MWKWPALNSVLVVHHLICGMENTCEGIKPWFPLKIFQSKLDKALHLSEKHDVRQTGVKEAYELVVLRLCLSIPSSRAYF